MAQDRRKKLEAAERLLVQGKIQAALLEFEDLARGSPRDILTLNRVGDVLARQGRNRDAVVYYRQIADQFAQGGFVPKAIAIHKKILRLTPDAPESLFSLGNLYAEQRLPGEARAHLLRAAELQLQARRFGDARKAYERLAALEPEDPRHRARLAEARAAEGETKVAGHELVTLAEWLLARKQVDDAERTFRRAAELVPNEAGPTLGVARCLEARGNLDGAIAVLMNAEPQGAGVVPIVGARLALLDRSGRSSQVAALLDGTASRNVPDLAIVELFRSAIERGAHAVAWERYGTVLMHWSERGLSERLERLYRQLGALEAQGHLPALEALYRLRESRTGTPELEEARGLLLRAYASRSMEQEARSVLGVAARPAPAAAPSKEPTAGATGAPADRRPGEATARVPTDLEAPAVPLSRGDEEFVAGRLTQAEILEKYGLRDEAVRQLREIADRYPGHVLIQERLVEILREGAERPVMRDALVALALARRAAGDVEGARRAAAEAVSILAVEEPMRAALDRLGVLGRPSVARPAARPTPRPKPAPAAAHDAGRAVTIDFDDGDDESEDRPAATPAPAVVSAPIVSPPVARPEPPRAEAPRPPSALPLATARRTPGSDMVREIEELLETGSLAEAKRRIAALATLGYDSPDLDELRARVGALSDGVPSVQRDVPLAGLLEDDDLGAITAALESELLAPELSVPTPDPESEQSLADVFAAFRQHVADEIEGDDYRTHYDLGIAYKEMGLLDDSIEQFRHVLGSPDLRSEAMAMLAVCLRDAGRFEESVRSYREAIAACREDDDVRRSLRYELADVLLGAGDADGALGEFRGVLASDPSFRDVRERVAQLEG
jgi:tetratricopeptide (TPR) repeat protein